MNSANFDGQIKLEEALKKSEEKYRYLYNESQVFNIIVNLDGTIKDVNKFVINKLKYSKEEIIGKSVTNFVIEDQKEKIKETIEYSIRGGSHAALDVFVCDKEGDIHTIMFSKGHAALYENGKISGLIFTGIDVTERRSVEQNMDESRKNIEKSLFFTSFLSRTAMHFVKNINNDDIFKFIAKEVYGIVGDSVVMVSESEQVPDSHLNIFVVREIIGNQSKLEEVKKILNRDLVGSRVFFDPNDEKVKQRKGLEKAEYGLHGISFKQIPLEISLEIEKRLGFGYIYTTPFALEGDLLGSVAIFTYKNEPLPDQSFVQAFINQAAVALQRRRAQIELQNAHDELEYKVAQRTAELIEVNKKLNDVKRLSDIGTLAATVAHELRNPLGVIRTAAYNISRKVKTADIEKHLVHIEKKILESDQIINNLLNYSNIKMPNYEKINIYDFLEECVAFVKGRFEKQEVLIFKKFRGLKKRILIADSFQLREVFNNILDNAFQAMAEKSGKLTIKSKIEGNNFIVYFKDNGIGIAKDELNRVFEPFFTKKSKGTGLGLAICSELINLHNGTININSKIGKGTEVEIRLPIKGDINGKKNTYDRR